jgi:hypothetical protein
MREREKELKQFLAHKITSQKLTFYSTYNYVTQITITDGI